MKRDGARAESAGEQTTATAADDQPSLKRKRGRPHKENHFAVADDTTEEPLKGGVPCEAHHHIANDQTQWTDYFNVVAQSEDDPALRVSINRTLLVYILTYPPEFYT